MDFTSVGDTIALSVTPIFKKLGLIDAVPSASGTLITCCSRLEKLPSCRLLAGGQVALGSVRRE